MAYQLPGYLKALSLSALPDDYEWDNVLFNTFWNAHDESSPRLAAVINPINGRAAFALGIACSEWVLARVDGHTDTADAQLRIEAAWAAVADWRYAKLPPPASSPATAPKVFASPLRLAMKILAHAHELYSAGSVDVNSRAQGLAMDAEHVAGRHPAFEPWLTESLRRCNQFYPDTGVPIPEQPAVPRELFDPQFTLQDGAAQALLDRYVETLDPSGNPYLRSPAEMLELGFTGTPYNRPL
jgi:hypothetical protein